MKATRTATGRLKIAMVVVVLLAAASGCARRDPLAGKVSASSSSAFNIWQARMSESISLEQRGRLADCLQEIRLKIMGDREIKRAMEERPVPEQGSVEDSLRQMIDQRALRDVLQLGYELWVRRLKAELTGLEYAMTQNSQLVTKPGDLESKHHLEGVRERQRGRVEKYRDEIAAAEKELAPLLKISGKALVPAATDKPDVMPEPVGKSRI